MNRNLMIGAGVLILLVVGYMLLSNKQQPAPEPQAPIMEETASPSATMSDITVTLAEQNDSGESGVATLSEAEGKVKVILKLTGAPAGITQPAHIHMGKCPEVGAVKYPLTSPVDGMSETMLDVSIDKLRSELPLGINVHKSTTASTVYVSCGDLTL